MDERTKQLLTLGREHFDKHEFEQAEKYFRELLKIEGGFADVHNMLGVIHHDRGRFGDAQSAFEKALAINPNYTEAALNLAVTYNDLSRYDDAKRVYAQAIERGAKAPGELDPFIKGKLANLHAELSRAYSDAGLLGEAMHELRKAILLCPTFADLRVRLANLYRQQGDHAAARFELQEAIKARPQYVPAHLALGVVMLTLGDSAGADAAWRAALAIDPDNRYAQSYLRMSQVPPGGSMAPPPSDPRA